MTDRSRILVIGDSYSSALEAGSRLDRGWPHFLGIPPANRQAVAGSTAEQWANDHEQRLSFAMRTNADVVILSLLGNDAFAVMADNVLTAPEISTSLLCLRRVVTALKNNGSRRIVVLLYPDPFCGLRPEFEVAVPILNGAIRAACIGVGVQFFDLSLIMDAGDFDGRDIHPVQTGHEKIADNLATLLELGGVA